MFFVFFCSFREFNFRIKTKFRSSRIIIFAFVQLKFVKNERESKFMGINWL